MIFEVQITSKNIVRLSDKSKKSLITQKNLINPKKTYSIPKNSLNLITFRSLKKSQKRYFWSDLPLDNLDSFLY